MPKTPTVKPKKGPARQVAYIPLYKVVLHNDDVNTMEHVVRVLIRVFRFDREAAERVMFEAHREGAAVCAVEPLEQAELHRDQLISFSLVATLEKE